ncbi:MAG: NUDIX hydrolase [Solirubrobacteraceae bacterium]
MIGGFCNFDEHPASTAEREVYEETGIKVRTTGILGIWMDTYGSGQPNVESTTNIYYNAVPTSDVGEAQIDPNEITTLRWFSAGDLPDALAFPDHSRKSA